MARRISALDRSRAIEDPLPLAPILRVETVRGWDYARIEVLSVRCPYCRSEHRHGGTYAEAGTMRVAHCGVGDYLLSYQEARTDG